MITKVEVTPEKIAKDILKWTYSEKGGISAIFSGWYSKEPSGYKLQWGLKELPTFKEPEWLGVIMQKASNISQYIGLDLKIQYHAFKHSPCWSTEFGKEEYYADNSNLAYSLAESILRYQH